LISPCPAARSSSTASRPCIPEYRDIDVAVRDAFDAAKRRRRTTSAGSGGRKGPTVPPHGVTQLFPEQGYGFLQTPDGHEVYFHRNSVLDGGFDWLEVGTEVTFAEEEGKARRPAR
jgi:cold shock CspA family protein